MFRFLQMLENFKKWPYFDDDDIQAVADVLRSGKINRWTGSKNTEFEAKICESVNCKYAIALANGSLALRAIIESLNLRADDEVVVPCRTFIATASEVLISGAKPVFADVDLDSQNITPSSILKCITPKTKAIIVVHHAGYPCDMDAILDIAKKYNLIVIEDCAQAHGAVYKGCPVGSIGHVAAWSYCQDKIITTGGEGGAITTNDREFWRRIWSYKDHGKDYDLIFNSETSNRSHEVLGTNLRMTEIQATLGICGYNKLRKNLDIRRRNVSIYNDTFKRYSNIIVPDVPDDLVHSFYKYHCRINTDALKSGWSRDRIVSEISEAGVPCSIGSCWNISEEKCFKSKGLFKSEIDLSNAFVLKQTSIMFLVHSSITEDDMSVACKKISKVLADAQR